MVAQLNMFAGQLWLKLYDEYSALCRFLGLSYKSSDEKAAADDFTGKTLENPGRWYERSPVAFLKAVTRIRMNCQHVNGAISGGFWPARS